MLVSLGWEATVSVYDVYKHLIKLASCKTAGINQAPCMTVPVLKGLTEVLNLTGKTKKTTRSLSVLKVN
jgi:hypothetical protein